MSYEYEQHEKRRKYKKIALTIVITAVIIAAILAPFIYFGFETVGVNKVALKKDDISNKVSDKIYETDIYWIGPTFSFIRFATIQQEIKLVESSTEDVLSPLDSRTQDGLLIYVQVVFFYRLDPTKVNNLFFDYGTTYQDVFIGQSRATLRDVISYYNAIEFFTSRSVIAENMKYELEAALNEKYAFVPSFQLREIDLPDEFEQALERVQIAQQEYQVALYEQQAALVRAETEIYVAQANANITIITAEASAEAYIINMQAQAKGLNITLTQQSLSYYALGQALNLSSTELLAYLWIQAILEHDSSLLIIGSDTPIILGELYTNTTKME